MSERINLSLLPDFNSLRSQVDWDYTLRNYIETRGSIELAVAFANLFWPEFVERRGCVVRADGFNEENFEQWWRKTAGDRVAIERSLNVLHIAELVPSDPVPVDDAVLRYLGRQIAEMWSNRVASLFPDRVFKVWFEGEDQDGNPTSPTVYLHQGVSS